MKTQFVYIESKNSLAFQWLGFATKEQAERFCRNLMESCPTLRARLVTFNN